jgi:hypothetical protein
MDELSKCLVEAKCNGADDSAKCACHRSVGYPVVKAFNQGMPVLVLVFIERVGQLLRGGAKGGINRKPGNGN